MIPSCESYNCQCERCENYHIDCCDTHNIECPKMGKLQEPCDGFKAKDKECKPDNEPDFVKVIRCKDCRHVNWRERIFYFEGQNRVKGFWCNVWDSPVKAHGFCNHGERK